VPGAVLIGASAGGIEPLLQLVEGLPPDIPAPVLVVVHVPPDADSQLPAILSRRGRLPASHAVDGVALRDGHIYVGPPDHHLLLEDGLARVVRGPRQNRHRPAIDTLLRSAARWHGPQAVTVILSGVAGDAVAGCLMIGARGGRVIVQDPTECLFPGMPSAVLGALETATAVPIAEMSDAVVDAVGSVPTGVPGTSQVHRAETIDDVETPMKDIAASPTGDTGRPSYSCPDCGGVLEEVEDPIQLRFRCRVGHSFYAEDLESAQWSKLEEALWAALRGMEETAELSSRLGRMAEERRAPRTAARHRRRADDVLDQAQVIRDFLLSPRLGLDAAPTPTASESVSPDAADR
jgi:two-component system, chemotaxis family, protein-glutamate methylesterase/glutaminase